MIDNVISLTSGKGGVGKSLLTASTAAWGAASGWGVLIVDLDRSGDMAVNLGYGPRSDGGLNLADAVTSGAALRPLEGVRENLDVICGGPHVDAVTEALTTVERRGGEPHRVLEEILAPIAATKSLVMIDLPPTAGVLHRATFGLGGYIAVPTAVDRCSVNGLAAVFEQLLAARGTVNPGLELLGVILNGVDSRATTITAEVKARLADLLGDTVDMLGPPIRWAPKAVYDMREEGLAAHEYHAEAEAEAKRRLGRLRRRDTNVAGGGVGRRYAANSGTFAADVTAVADALLAAYSEALTERRSAGHNIDLRAGVHS